MMVSTTVCSPSVTKRLCFLLFALALVFPALLWAAEIEVSNPQVMASEDGYVLSADFKFEFNQRLEEAVTKGVVLYFVAEFELTKPRWYWLEEKAVSRSQTYRLSYHALTRQYRVSTTPCWFFPTFVAGWSSTRTTNPCIWGSLIRPPCAFASI